MELRVLGCNGPYPAADGACSGYLLTESGQSLLLDCGCGVLGKLTRYIDPASLCGVVLSHLHADHCGDMPVLAYLLQKRGATLDVWLPLEDESPYSMLLSAPCFVLHDIKDGVNAGVFSARTVRTAHPAPCYAQRYGDFVYTGDTNAFDGLTAFCHGASTLLCDAAFTSAQWTPALPHLSAALAGETAKAACAQRLMITHFSPEASQETLLAQARAAFDNTQAAVPGMRVAL